MSVALPTAISQASARVRYLDWGADLMPSLGGPVQRLDRLGSRHAVDFALPPIGTATAAMQWCQRLKRAKSLGALMAFPQVGFNPGSPGSPVIYGSYSATATSIAMRSASGSYLFYEGQYFSVIHGGRRYLYAFDGSGVFQVDGSQSGLSITPMLRTALSDGDTVELSTPMIEGTLGGDELGWNIDDARTYGLAFSISEME